MKALKLTMILLLIAVLTQSQRPAGRVGTQTQIPLEGTVFHIRNVAANRYIDLPGRDTDSRSRENGANVQLWDLDNGGDRKMVFVPAGNGYYYIRFQHANVQ
ncbi:MAG: RICIN domain-containing protein, partial [Bacteroidota bacterium]